MVAGLTGVRRVRNNIQIRDLEEPFAYWRGIRAAIG
jgi:hypothetical protein